MELCSNESEEELLGVILSTGLSDEEVLLYVKYQFAGKKEVHEKAFEYAAMLGKTNLLKLLKLEFWDNLSFDHVNCYANCLVTSIHAGQVDSIVRLAQWSFVENEPNVLFDGDCWAIPGSNGTSGMIKPFAWGSNAYYTLGMSSHRNIPVPEPIDYFFKNPLVVEKVAMGKYHTVFLTTDGVYTCGLGSSTGLKSEQVVPCKIPMDVKIDDVSVGDVHTLFLGENVAYSAGRNTYRCLGLSENPMLVAKPTRCSQNHVVALICAGPQHSVVVAENQIYTCGVNLGQIGHPIKEEFVSHMRAVPSEATHKRIFKIATSLNVTVFVTWTKIIIWTDFKKISTHLSSIMGSFDPDAVTDVDVSSCGESASEKKIAITVGGKVYLWTSFSETLTRCTATSYLVNFKLTPDGCVFLNDTGRLFLGSIKNLSDEETHVEGKLLAGISGGKQVCVDRRGQNFIVLQKCIKYPERNLIDFEKTNIITVRKNLCQMFEDGDETDVIHDIVFKTHKEVITAHSCVIFHPFLVSDMEKLLNGDASKKTYNVDFEPRTFRRFLRFLYYPFEEIALTDDSKLSTAFEKIKERAREAAQKGINRTSGDFTLIAKDKTKFQVHKCVLAARVEYFKVFFSPSWQHKLKKQLETNIDVDILSAFIDVIYTGTSEFFQTKNVESLARALSKSDEYLFGEFRDLVEYRLQDCVNSRNAMELVTFAWQSNTPLLLKYLQDFVVTNITFFLENRMLENLTDEELKSFNTAFNEVYNKHRYQEKLSPVKCSELVDKVRAIIKRKTETAGKKVNVKKSKPERLKEPRVRNLSEPSSETVQSSSTPSPNSPKKINQTEKLSTDVSSTHTVEKRLLAISKNLHAPLPVDNFTLLCNDFPLLNSPPRFIPSQKTSPGNLPKKFSRPSQRVRKRLTSGSSTGDESCSQDLATSPQSPWAAIPPSPSFPELESIVCEEKEERKRIARVLNKPLDLTLMEDQAMRELEIFYNVSECTEERITVERLSTTVTIPTPAWPPQSNIARALR